MVGDKKRCFVIMPFSRTEHRSDDYWARHFASYLKPLIEKTGELEAFRSEPLRGDIASQIVTDLINSDVVVADLTDHNPNVLWELGVRQSYRHCTITIAEEGTQIPFHFSHKGILFYNGDHLDNRGFEERFLASLKDCIEHPNEPDSPVLETMGGRGTLYSIIHNEENRRKVTALRKEIDDNEATMKEVYTDCAKNAALRAEGKSKECTMTPVLLSSSSTEFLCVNRYLDLDEAFYNALLGYYRAIEVINERLAGWQEKSGLVEKYLVSNQKVLAGFFDQVKEYLGKLAK